jgi:hypothetical protein
MSDELSYINENGDSVHTSKYLSNRKSCCKTFCLHCPYGTTLKEHGLVFTKVTADPESLKSANSIIKEDEGADTLGSSMIDSAFGGKKQTKISKYNYENFLLFSLKGYLSGVARLKQGEVKEVFLRTHFKNQGLDLPSVSTIYQESK